MMAATRVDSQKEKEQLPDTSRYHNCGGTPEEEAGLSRSIRGEVLAAEIGQLDRRRAALTDNSKYYYACALLALLLSLSLSPPLQGMNEINWMNSNDSFLRMRCPVAEI